MRNKLVISTFSALILGIGIATISLSARPARADDPSHLPSQNPVETRFDDAITFYASFDGYATADLSDGNGAPQQNSGTTEWSDGHWNKALQGLAKPLQYQAKDNIDLTRPGGVVMWISPQNWTHKSQPGYINFIVVNYQGITLQVSRMGSSVNQEKLYAWFKSQDKGVIDSAGTSVKWDNEWHLLAANWGNGYVEFSVDGNAFHREATQNPAPYNGNNPGIMYIASGCAGSYPYLMDELFIFNRPLTNDEVQWIYQSRENK